MAGDALEMATVKRALTGVGVVTQSLGVSAGPEIILKPTRLFSKAMRVLVTAMEQRWSPCRALSRRKWPGQSNERLCQSEFYRHFSVVGARAR